jgi:hypothetical protein
MIIKNIVSAIALTAALTLSGPAFSQTMLNGAEISADDLPAVQERCDQLKLAADKDGTTEGDQATAAATTEGTTTAADASTETDTAEPVSEAAAALTGSVDLDTLTLEACTEAGLLEAAAM